MTYGNKSKVDFDVMNIDLRERATHNTTNLMKRTNITYIGKIYYGTTVFFRLQESNKNIALMYTDEGRWVVSIDLQNDTVGHLVFKKNGIESHLTKDHVIKAGVDIVLEYPCISQYCLEINRSQGLLDPHYKSCTDGEMWCSVKWLQRNGHRFPNELLSYDSMEEFNPKVCHRKLFKLSINSSKYIYSPFGQADNKYTPIQETANYKLAKILNPPHPIHLPKTSVCLIDGLGIGSLKEFINIKDKLITTNKLPSKIKAWVACFDFIIINIERDWNDHLCIDDKDRLCLLDNDTGLEHLNKFKSFKFNQVSENIDSSLIHTLTDIKNHKGIVYEQFLDIKAPSFWYEAIQSQISRLLKEIK